MTTSSEQLSPVLVSDLVVDGLLKFLRSFFSTFPVFTWDADDTKTGLQIIDFDAFNLDAVDKKPRIAVELVEGHWENLMVNNMQAMDLVRATETVSDLVKASVTLHCISSVSIEAKRLADIVFEAIRLFRSELRREMDFFNIDSLHRGREQRIVTAAQPVCRVVPVEVAVSIQRTMVKFVDRQVFEASGP
jgi:hypothetical protein